MPKIDAQGRDLSEDKVFVVRVGILNMWVCAPKHMTREQVQKQVDLTVFPAGTTLGWQVQEEQNDNPQLASPGKCAEDCNRQHWNCEC